MSNETAQRVIDRDSESGYRRDLRDAELQIVAANGDPVALAQAFNRHAEAVRNMMIAEILPSFERVLTPLLDDKLAPVVTGIAGLQVAVNVLHAQFQQVSAIVNQLVTDIAESKEDRKRIHGSEDSIKEELHALTLTVARLEADFTQYRLSNRRTEIDTIQQQLTALRGVFSDEERTRLTNVLLAMIKDYEATHSP